MRTALNAAPAVATAALGVLLVLRTSISSNVSGIAKSRSAPARGVIAESESGVAASGVATGPFFLWVRLPLAALESGALSKLG
jgi:hypothetical protein